MKKKHVLLIDDNEIDNYVNNHFVTSSKITDKITIKTSAVDALEYLHDIKNTQDVFPDLIFLDIRMPIMNGFEFLEEFMKFPEAINNECIVFMLTSSSSEEDINQASQYQIVKKFLTKPIQLEVLKNL